MKTFRMNKLVRDRVVDNILKRGGGVRTRALTDSELFKELKTKLMEEAKEVNEVEMGDKENLINELVDTQLIINYLAKIAKLQSSELKKAEKDKLAKVGSFDKKIFIETVGLLDDDEWVERYRQKGFEEVKK